MGVEDGARVARAFEQNMMAGNEGVVAPEGEVIVACRGEQLRRREVDHTEGHAGERRIVRY